MGPLLTPTKARSRWGSVFCDLTDRRMGKKKAASTGDFRCATSTVVVTSKVQGSPANKKSIRQLTTAFV